MSKLIFNHFDAWDFTPSGSTIHIRIERNTMMIALVVSILLHLSSLWFFAPRQFSMGVTVKDSPPFEVTLGPPQKKKEIVVSEPALRLPQARPQPIKPPLVWPKKATKENPIPPKQVKPEALVRNVKESDLSVPKSPEKQQEPEPEIVLEPLPGEDMQAYIKRQKEAKLAAKGYSKQEAEEVLASSSPQSAGSQRDATIKENLNFNGTNGIFEIRELSLRSARFNFRGWKNNVNTARLEIIDVQVSDGEDIKRAVIKSMIEIIHREYSGDFNWDSRRLGRILVLSARWKDNDALEDFMMTEFFGNGTRVR